MTGFMGAPFPLRSPVKPDNERKNHFMPMGRLSAFTVSLSNLDVKNKKKKKLTVPIDSIPRRLFSSRSTGYLLNRIGVLSLLAVLLLAGWHNQIGIIAILSLFLVAAGISKAWSHLSLSGVHCHRVLSARRIFPGETMELALELVNRKPIPLPWIRVEDEMPLPIAPDGVPASDKRPGFGVVQRTTALMWYSKSTWRFRLEGDKRGYYPFGPMTVTSGDIFGLYSRSMTLPITDHILIYPRIFPINRVMLPSLHPLGESRTERRIFEDPARTIGIRDYQPYDSLRHIHWKASARSQKLQVKVFEPTTTFKVALFLAAGSFHSDESFLEDEFELGISTAASIAYAISEQGSPVGLFANTASAESGQGISIPPGADRHQLIRLLEALAMATPKENEPFEALMERVREGLPAGTTLILICAGLPASLSGLLQTLKKAGHQPLIFLIGEHERPFNETVPWQNIRNSGDLGEVKGIQ